jgi:hypothetical protein
MDLDFYNLTDKTRLREVWVNLYFAPSKVTRAQNLGIRGIFGLLVPGEKRTVTFETVFSGSGRILQLMGGRRMWTRRFAAWVNDKLVYDSHDFKTAVAFNYDSITTNPAPDPSGKREGATSGVLAFGPGDVLKFSCFIENDTSYNLEEGSATRGDERCGLWGMTADGGVDYTELVE